MDALEAAVCGEKGNIAEEVGSETTVITSGSGNHLIPYARSYSGNDWEASGGPYAAKSTVDKSLPPFAMPFLAHFVQQ